MAILSPVSSAAKTPHIDISTASLLDVRSLRQLVSLQLENTMADPLSIAASVVGIAVPALHATRLLLTDLQELKNAPSTMQQLQEDLRIIDAAITSLQAVDDTEWTVLGEEVAENSKTTIGTCQTACTSFRADIQRWTRHSTGGKLSWQDRASVGFFNQGRIKSLTEQLQSCKLTINSVAGVAVL